MTAATTEAAGIVGYHAYLPAYRLSRADIAASVGASARGARCVAGYDEDSTTLGVAAALPVVAGREPAVGSVWLATTDPVYADKTNATAVHAALGLPAGIVAADLGASVRSGVVALLAAARDGGLAVLADRRGGPAGGTDERDGGDAAAAFLFGDEAPLAVVAGTASVTAEFIDRWRAPGTPDGAAWEERFGEQRYAELAEQLVAGLAEAGVEVGSVSRFAVAGVNARAVRAVAGTVGKATGAALEGGDLAAAIGNAGAAQAGLALASLLDAASPGETLLLISLADGADALVLRATDAIDRGRGEPLRAQVDGAGVTIGYPQYLLWRGRIAGERSRRPDPERPSAPFAWRNRGYKLSMAGGRCRKCGALQFPLPRVCYQCRAVDEFDSVSVAGQTARIVTFTVDRLAFSPSPPLISAIIAFEGGGRLQCELTDVRQPLQVGDEVVPTFRRGATVGGIHNYLWKARPVYRAVQDNRGARELGGPVAQHSLSDRVAIISMGCTRFAEHFDQSADGLAVDAVTEALDGAGLTSADIDAFWLGTYVSGISGIALARPLKLAGKPVTRVENMCATGSEALRAAVHAVACGAVDVAMAVGVEKLKDTGYAGLISPKTQDDGTRVNTSAPANFSLLAPAYKSRYGVAADEFRAAMTHVAWKNHANGALNPRAQFRKAVSKESIERSPAVAGELGVLDCSGVADGAAAAIVVRAQDAHRYTDNPLYIKALALVTGDGSGAADPRYDYTSFPEVVECARQAYAQAGITDPRRELALAEVHDCFTPTEIVLMEDLGFAERGGAWREVLDGVYDRDGALPVNPDGGLKSFGHPVGASGLRMIFECWLQLRGQAGDRQVGTADRGLALTQNLGGAPGDCVCFISIVGSRLG